MLEDAWSVESILQYIAKAGMGKYSKRIDVLIDCGAIITGMRNEEVAQYLLDHGLPWAKGVVFLDDNDEKCVMLRAGGHDEGDATGGEPGRVLKLSQCGLAWEDRFTFYDQIHTTGMDIKQHKTSNAVITIGKDTTFRDFAQGAYRMRGLAKGQPQTLDIFLIPEVLGMISKEVKVDFPQAGAMPKPLGEEAPGAAAAWMLLNSIRLESKQMMQLCKYEHIMGSGSGL